VNILNDLIRIKHKISDSEKYIFSKCNQPEIKAACILDPFSYECFKYEADFKQILLESWKTQIKNLQPHFLFVESSINTTWGSVLFKEHHVLRKEFFSLLTYCKENKIPSVFWNKEDPVYFSNLIGTAKLFDYIFTTDENCVDRYIALLGHNRVYVLPFAAQPALQNPVNSSYFYKNDIAFAGTWYRTRFLERQNDMHLVLNPAKEFGLHIFDRMHNFTQNRNYKFPDEYEPYIVGELDYINTSKVYKLYKIFLNVNSVKNSPTMFSRRVFEILASGTNVVSTYSKGVENFFGDLVLITSSQDETKKHLSFLLNNPEYSQRLSLLGIRAVHKNHLYRHRLNTVLEKIGLQKESGYQGVSIIVCTKRSHFMDNILENYLKQDWDTKELIVILHNDEIDINSWNLKINQCPNLSVYRLSENLTLGECLNFAVSKAKYNYVAKLDDDDYYGPYFLTDLMNAFNYSDADIVGKLCHYAYLESIKTLVLRFSGYENKFTDFLVGSFIVKKAVFSKVQFDPISVGEISRFLRKCSVKGFKIYSADRYNYVYIRRSNHDDHSWKRTTSQLLAENNCSIIAVTEDFETHVTV
jgi:spore maturation protein CgeB